MSMTSGARRVLRLLTRAPAAPLRQLTLYYAGLTALALVLAHFVPALREVIQGVPVSGATDGEGLRDLLTTPATAVVSTLAFDLRMALVMMGTLLITIPFSWGYMSIRAHSGFEQSVVQTLVILPIVVAGIMMIVQFSLALAFALGGVAAAVRFRNTLKDVADATYVFLAIGIGISAGTGAVSASLVMSAVFTYASVLLWRCNFGECDVVATVPEEPPPRARRSTPPRDMAIEVHGDSSQGKIEEVLAANTKRWKLRGTAPTAEGATRLQYALRLKRSVPLDDLLTALRVHSPDGVSVTQRAADPGARA